MAQKPAYEDSRYRAFRPIFYGATQVIRYQHDHDEELATYWYGAGQGDGQLPLRDVSHFRVRDGAYWRETGQLISDYLFLQVGRDDFELYRLGFFGWLRSSGALKRYENGQDMDRAALVDWFLKLVR